MNATLAINAYPNLIKSSLPLLASEKVDALEWSFDTIDIDQIPEWFDELLQAYSAENRLIGHGVFFGMMRGMMSSDQKLWLSNLEKITKKYSFDHISEHFGYFSGADFHSGAPLPVPMNKSTLNIGIDRMKRMQQASNCIVGIENLAFSGSLSEVKYHGEFLDKLINPVDGFILLDFHNLYCQMLNFDIPFDTIIESYPLDRVREIHISGGSWDMVSSQRNIRRDTHDSSVPSELMALLETHFHKFKNLRYITLEQMDYALHTDEESAFFQSDFDKIKNITAEVKANPNYDFEIKKHSLDEIEYQDKDLYEAQILFSSLLENSRDISDLSNQMTQNKSKLFSLEVDKWDIDMLETAMKIAQKWK